MAYIENIYQSRLLNSVDSKLSERLVEKLGLAFLELQDLNLDGLSERNENTSPVCYADDQQVREEFKIKTIPLAFSSLDLADYIYANLHASSLRKERENLEKIDVSKVPCPEDKEAFWKLVNFGRELRELHLLVSPKVKKLITSYPQDGSNTVARAIGKKDWELYDPANQLGRIWINDEQCFDKIPLVVWEFYIGGYQPAQKWLKDRKGRGLSFDDILHYQKIIVALSETDRLMKEIDKVEV